MVANNIKAIWNFTPQKLSVAENVLVKQENLALSIAHLNNQLVSYIESEAIMDYQNQEDYKNG